ncbi:type III polyketide synthase [Vulgatibacter incomptus]|nr:3-oxoacyl-[acyl-carrier-protein] synthase III C-terminal domain-containing protein [Vulgatibacter incomptus]
MNLAAVADPALLSAASALPPHYVGQEELLAALRARWSGHHFNLDRLDQLHRAVGVEGRHLALPLADYEGLDSFAKANRAWVEVASALGEKAARLALDRAGLGPGDVDRIFFVSTTGIATPSVDALLTNRLGLRDDVKRTPIFGLGCAAGVAGVARAADVLRAFPGEVALLVSVELCSLTLQRDDFSIANAIATGLFGDGAAAAVIAGADRGSGPRIERTRSVFYPNTEDVMGWNVVEGGLRIVLSAQIPSLVRERIGGDVDAFLRSSGVSRTDVRQWICHPGGPKVLEALAETLGLTRDALARTWRTLEKVGNLSSASVLFVLEQTLEGAASGDTGLMLAMGPGFSTELVLLRW